MPAKPLAFSLHLAGGALISGPDPGALYGQACRPVYAPFVTHSVRRLLHSFRHPLHQLLALVPTTVLSIRALHNC